MKKTDIQFDTILRTQRLIIDKSIFLFLLNVQRRSENITCIKSFKNLSFGLVLFMLVLPLKLEKKRTNYPHRKATMYSLEINPLSGSALAGKYHIAMH